MHYREATPDDVQAIMDVRLSVLENRLADLSRVTPAMCEEYLTAIGRGWVCEIDGQIVGFSIASSRDSSIWALFIRPGFEALGIGRTLLNFAVKWLFDEGAAEISLRTDPGTRADRFYQAQGWARGEVLENGEVRFRLRRGGG